MHWSERSETSIPIMIANETAIFANSQRKRLGSTKDCSDPNSFEERAFPQDCHTGMGPCIESSTTIRFISQTLRWSDMVIATILLLQPFVSIARFSTQFVMLPNQMTIEPICVQVSPVGWYRPGEVAPKLLCVPGSVDSRSRRRRSRLCDGLLLFDCSIAKKPTSTNGFDKVNRRTTTALSKLNCRVPLLAGLRASSALKDQSPTVKTLLLRRLRSNGTQPDNLAVTMLYLLVTSAVVSRCFSN